MAAVDDGLVQVASIEEQADFVVVVQVRVGKHEVAIAFYKMHADPASSNKHLRDHALHCFAEFNADGIRMIADNFDAVDRGKPLFVPRVRLHGARRRGSSMIADYTNRRSGSGHYDSGRSSFATHGSESRLRQIEDQRLRDPIRPFIQSNHTVARINCMLQRFCVICDAVADRTEPKNIGHREALPGWASRFVLQGQQPLGRSF